jgi:hypothetical protein
MNAPYLATIILWIVPLGLQVAIAVAMLCRKLTGAFPIFFAYTVVVPTRDIILLFLKHPGTSYFFVYWVGEGFAVLLGLGVILEVARHLVQPHRFLGFLLKALSVLAAFAVPFILVMLFLTSGRAEVFEAMVTLERTARFLQVCMLIVVLSLMSRLGLIWHHYSVGIAAGFGVYSALDLALLEFRGHLHFIPDSTFVLLRSAAYNLAGVIWASYFLKSWRRKPIDRLPEVDLENWNNAVTGYIGQWYRRYWS